MDKNKVERVCRFCFYSLGCSESCLPDVLISGVSHACVYEHPDELGFVHNFDNY